MMGRMGFTRRRTTTKSSQPEEPAAAGPPPAAKKTSRVVRPQDRPRAEPEATSPPKAVRRVVRPASGAAPAEGGAPTAEAVTGAPASAAGAGASQPAPASGAARGFDRIVRNVFRLELREEDFERLMSELELKDPTSIGEIDRSLNKAEKNAMLAHRMKVVAEVEHDVLRVETLKALADLRERAHTELQNEKAQGVRNKAITDADVESRMASLDPEVFQTVKRRETERERTISHIGHLAERWAQRARTLAAMRQR